MPRFRNRGGKYTLRVMVKTNNPSSQTLGLPYNSYFRLKGPDGNLIEPKRLASFLRDMQSQVHRVRVLWPSTVARLEETWKEHAAILAALRARDGAEAERLMRQHLERAQASTLNRILPANPGDLSTP